MERARARAAYCASTPAITTAIGRLRSSESSCRSGGSCRGAAAGDERDEGEGAAAVAARRRDASHSRWSASTPLAATSAAAA